MLLVLSTSRFVVIYALQINRILEDLFQAKWNLNQKLRSTFNGFCVLMLINKFSTWFVSFIRTFFFLFEEREKKKKAWIDDKFNVYHFHCIQKRRELQIFLYRIHVVWNVILPKMKANDEIKLLFFFLTLVFIGNR